MNEEKRHIPGTNPNWNFETPEGMTNSMVDEEGRNVDTGWNFDEWDDDKPEDEEQKTGWDDLVEQ